MLEDKVMKLRREFQIETFNAKNELAYEIHKKVIGFK